MSDRRNFLKQGSLALLPGLLPVVPAFGNTSVSATTSGISNVKKSAADAPGVNFISDADMVSPSEYIAKLAEIDKKSAIQADSYASGGPVPLLEKQFELLTGKQRAIYMPTGTMANELAIAALSGANSKVFVQETSHVYRDEADAAQSVHSKRLIPLAAGQASFTLEQLKEAVEYHTNGEAFKSPVGAVSIENPVRRGNGAQVPFEELKKISSWCRENKIKLHLDGARLMLATAYSGVSIKEYAALFDTIYISLYKYLGAAGGAVLCGDAELIGSMAHQVKIHGGAVYRAWPQAAVALHQLDGFEKRYKAAVEQANDLFKTLNTLAEIRIDPIPNGSNVYFAGFGAKTDAKKFSESLSSKYNIRLSGSLNDKGLARVAVNESIAKRSNADLVAAFKGALMDARK